MKIQWAGIWLSDELSSSKAQSNLSVNGRQVIQDAQFLRAATEQLFARHNRSVQIAFTVNRTFETIETAEQYVLGYYSILPDGPDTLICVCDNTTIFIPNTVLESVNIPRYIGTAVEIHFTFRCPKIVTTITGEEDDLSDPSVARSGSLPIT